MMSVPSYAAAFSACAATQVAAQDLSCVMADGEAVDFTIDRNQFIDAVSPEEPIRRKVTFVRMGAARFPAEPFIIDDLRGFHAVRSDASQIMFVVNPDGSATYANTTSGEKRFGICEDH